MVQGVFFKIKITEIHLEQLQICLIKYFDHSFYNILVSSYITFLTVTTSTTKWSWDNIKNFLHLDIESHDIYTGMIITRDTI